MEIQEIISRTEQAVVFIICIVKGKVRIPRSSEEGHPTQNYQTVNVEIGGFGSGFLVDPNGYIVTNGHVIFAFTHTNVQDDPYVQQLLFMKVADELDIDTSYAIANGQLETARRRVYVQLGVSDSGFDAVRKSIPARVLENPSPSSEKDIAIIKIDRLNLPYLELGESSNMRVGDPIYVVGYPGVVREHPYLGEESDLEPTVTDGIISSRRRRTKDGSLCLQTNADMTHGNSGGPAINKNGEVIGIATFGSLGRDGEVPGFNFLRPSELIDEFLQERGVRNVQVIRSINDIKDKITRISENTSKIKIISDKMNRFLKITKINGSWKRINCKYNKDEFCTLWSWDENPKIYNLNGKEVKTRKNPKGRYIIMANDFYCVTCSSFSEKEKTD